MLLHDVPIIAGVCLDHGKDGIKRSLVEYEAADHEDLQPLSPSTPGRLSEVVVVRGQEGMVYWISRSCKLLCQ